MLVVFLILFTCVLADGEEDKYVDLLPEDEKIQFIEQVARRILKDVHSQENKTGATSTEINDEQLRKHNDYVRAVLKEESEYIRRRKSELVKEKIENADSAESGKVLKSEKIAAIPDDGDMEQLDPTLRNDRRDDANPQTSTDYIKVEVITDEVPIIKRSIENDDPKNLESDKTTAETLVKISSKNRTMNFGDNILETPTRSTAETTEQSTTAKAVEALAESKSENMDKQTNSTDVNETDDKVNEKEEITTVVTTIDDKDKIGSVQRRRRGFGEIDIAQSDRDEPWMSKRMNVDNNVTEINNTTSEKTVDVSVSGEEITTIKAHTTTRNTDISKVEIATNKSTTEESITIKPLKITTETSKVINATNDSILEKNNETEINNTTATTSAVELFGLKSEEKASDESNHISSEETTTKKAHKTKTIASKTKVDNSVNDLTTEGNDGSEINDIVSTTSAVELFGLKSEEKALDESNHISSEEITTTKKARKIKTTTEKEVESTTGNAITENADKPRVRATDETNIDEETTTIKHVSKTKTTTETAVESVTINPTTESVEESQIKASIETDDDNDTTGTESTTIIPSSGERTTQPVPLTTEIEKPKESSHKTTEKNIIVKEFTQSPKKVKKKKAKSNFIKQRALDNSREFVSQVLEGSGKYVETGTIKSGKVKLNKLEKVILGPKGHTEVLQTEKPNPDKNFIELEKVYYENNYKVKKGKGYQVFEIKPGQTPFIRDELSMVEQPYYVPIYNYSPNNAYFNPQNRLGPNPGDKSAEKRGFEKNEAVENFQALRARPAKNSEGFYKKVKESDVNNDMEYNESDFYDKRKKFGTKQKDIHSIHQQPVDNQNSNNWGDVNPEDYADADYYFGRKDKRRVNPEELNAFPNSDEIDHPTHSIQEGNLKDHVRAVRNILFHQKSFGLLDKDKYGHELKDKKHQKDDLRQVKVGKYQKRHALRNADSVNKKGRSNHDKNKKQNLIKKQTQKRIARQNDENAILEAQNKDSDITINDEHIKKVGYLKNNNSTKALYIIDEDFRKDVLRYLEYLKQNEKDGLHPVTPLPPPQQKIGIPKELKETHTFAETQQLTKVEQVKIAKNVKDEAPVEPLPEIKIPDDVNETGINTEPPAVARQKEIISQLLKELPQDNNIRNHRRKNGVKLGDYLKVLKDMVNTDDNALKQYDWLGSTVDIQSAFQKMFELTGLVAARRKVHPADMEILKYVLFLHKLATEIIEANDFGDQLRKKLALNGNRRRRSQRLMIDRGLVNKLWLYLRKEVPDVYENGAMRQLNRFLMSIQDGLFELHVAVKNVAKITKYKNQHWYDNLKDLYINTEDKNLLELLLHMTVLRLFVLIEDSAKSGLEDNYIPYMKNNKKNAKRTLDEMIFVMQILDEYNKLER